MYQGKTWMHQERRMAEVCSFSRLTPNMSETSLHHCQSPGKHVWHYHECLLDVICRPLYILCGEGDRGDSRQGGRGAWELVGRKTLALLVICMPRRNPSSFLPVYRPSKVCDLPLQTLPTLGAICTEGAPTSNSFWLKVTGGKKHVAGSCKQTQRKPVAYIASISPSKTVQPSKVYQVCLPDRLAQEFISARCTRECRIRWKARCCAFRPNLKDWISISAVNADILGRSLRTWTMDLFETAL